MKITFSNLGAIKKTTLDLRPLTIIIGPNNSNKTYIAYSIYGIWKTVFDNLDIFPSELNYVQSSKDTLLLKIDGMFFEKYIQLFEGFIRKFESELDVFFQDSTNKLFNKTKFNFHFTKNELKRVFYRYFAEREYEVNGLIFVREKNILTIKQKNSQRMKDLNMFMEQATRNLTWLFSFEIFYEPFLLPAERNAFIITYKILEARRYNLLKNAQRKLISNKNKINQQSLHFNEENLITIDSIRYPQPIEDFLDFLTNLEIEKLGIKEHFSPIANDIEKFIQLNNKTKFISKGFEGKEIKVNVKKGLDIDLYNASSSIKQLAPLLLYLRYKARHGDLLIIDEPEMNLHPESQAKLLEVLGLLVNAGVNVLLTTHSPYFMSHLNNLISGDMTDEKIREKQAKSLYLEDVRAFLNPDDVSAYEMKKDRLGNQKLHDLKDKDYGIRWDTLSDVSADIQQKFFEIYEKGEDSSDGKEEKE